MTVYAHFLLTVQGLSLFYEVILLHSLFLRTVIFFINQIVEVFACFVFE